jgi:hypothetical protein
MPNWVENKVIISGTKNDMLKLFSKVLGKKASYASWEDYLNIDAYTNENAKKMTMRSWLPMPKTFKEWDTTNNMDTFEWFSRDKNLPQEELHKEYEKYVRGYKRACQYQRDKYGVVGWYDYNCLTLGCKWDAELKCLSILEETKDTIIIAFTLETAWSMPKPFLQHLTTFGVNVMTHSIEEGDFFDQIYDANSDIVIKDVIEEKVALFRTIVTEQDYNEKYEEQYAIYYEKVDNMHEQMYMDMYDTIQEIMVSV